MKKRKYILMAGFMLALAGVSFVISRVPGLNAWLESVVYMVLLLSAILFGLFAYLIGADEDMRRRSKKRERAKSGKEK